MKALMRSKDGLVGISSGFPCLFLIVLGTFAMCVPDELVNEDFDKAIRRAPLMAVKMVLNVFRLRGLKNKFLHTEHTITMVDK